MNILETVKQMSPAEVQNRIAAARIRNQGVYSRVLGEYWKEIQEEGKKETLPLKVIAGLDNSDTVGVFLQLLKKYPSKVMQGMSVAAYALGAEAMVLHIPEYAASLTDGLLQTAKEYQIEIAVGLIDRRNYRGGAMHHIAAMPDIADFFAGIYRDGIYVSVNGGELKKIPRDLKIKELIPDESVKGLELGYRLCGGDVLGLTVEEANIFNGVVRTLTERDCVVKLAFERLLADQKQACGKCVFCREGLIQLQEMQKDIVEGKGKQEYLEIIKEIGEAMYSGSLCSMGQQASQTALSAREYFYDEYEKHIKKKACSAKICFSLKSVYIDPNSCTGCEKCMSICPKDAILGKKGYIHMIDALDCTQCGVCVDVCGEKSIIVTEDKPPKLPERLTKCGRFKR